MAELQDIVGERYRVDALIGMGGMGRVYRGHDLVLDRPVAIKALAPQAASDPREQERLRREADALARLAHPHIVSAFELLDARQPLLILEWVAGQSLRHLLDEQGTLPLDQVARIGAEVAEALAAAHAIGIVHRDIKPANVLMDAGSAKVADFGLAFLGHELPRLTGMDHVLGTPEYMSPERFRGVDVAAAADVYALGIMLAELLSGDTPFSGSPLEIAHRVMHATEIELKLDAPAPLLTLLHAMVQPDPAKRPASCASIARTLRQFAHQDEHEVSEATLVVMGGLPIEQVMSARSIDAEIGQRIGADIVVRFPRAESAFRWVVAQREQFPEAYFAIEVGPLVGAGLGIFAGTTVATAARLARLARPGDLFVAPSVRHAIGLGFRADLEAVGHLHLAGDAVSEPTVHRVRREGACDGAHVAVEVLSARDGLVHFRCACGAEDVVRWQSVGEAGRLHCKACHALITLRLGQQPDGTGGFAPTRDVLRFDLEDNDLLNALADQN